MADDPTVRGGDIVPLPVARRHPPTAAPARRRRALMTLARFGLRAAFGRARQSLALYLLDVSGGLTRGLGTHRLRSGVAPVPVSFRCTVSLARPAAEAYAFWRDLDNLPRFMRHVARVEALGPGFAGPGRTGWTARTRWTAATRPGQRRVTWEAETLLAEKDRCLAWRSVAGSPLHHAGRVTFVPTRDGCEATIELDIRPTGPGVALALGLFHPVVGRELTEEMRRMKQLLETGQVTRADRAHRDTRPVPPHRITTGRDTLH